MAKSSASSIKKVLIIIGALVAITILVNFGYWSKQLSYVFSEPEDDPADQVGEKMEPNTIAIASLGIKAPIIYIEDKNEEAFQEALTRGVVHYPGTADIGNYGNAYLFGHSSDYIWKKGEYKTVFALLPKIKIGEKIKVSDKEGNTHTYTVKETLVASPGDTHLLSQYENKRRLLTLQTSYPIGTALKRYIVIAEI